MHQEGADREALVDYLPPLAHRREGVLGQFLSAPLNLVGVLLQRHHLDSLLVVAAGELATYALLKGTWTGQVEVED